MITLIASQKMIKNYITQDNNFKTKFRLDRKTKVNKELSLRIIYDAIIKE